MNLFPIVDRELRVAARRPSTYWIRTIVACLVLAISVWIYMISYRDPARQVGQTIFYVISGGALLVCILDGLRSTADCLSEEKREGTLGLLFLTDLKGYDVVFGKLAASSVNAIYGVLSVFPLMAVPLLMGGMAPLEFGRMVLVLLAGLAMSLSIGLFASAVCTAFRAVTTLATLLIFTFTAGCPILYAWLQSEQLLPQVRAVLRYPSAGYTYFTALDSVYKINPLDFYYSLGAVFAIGLAFLFLAILIAPQSWQDKPLGASKEGGRSLWRSLVADDRTKRDAFRRRALDDNAFYWLAAQPRRRPRWVWVVLALMAIVWILGALEFKRDWLNEGVYIATAILLNTLLKSWVAVEASRKLAQDRQTGALELLLSTPLSIAEILHGQWLALLRQFLAPLIVTLGLEFFMLAHVADTNLVGSDRDSWTAYFLATMMILVADLEALYWVGMWMGLSSKLRRRASGNAFSCIVVLPSIGYFGFVALAGLLSMGGNDFVFSWQFMLGVWIGLSLVTDIGFVLWARRKLMTEFRAAAAARYQIRPSLWSTIFGSGTARPE